jgi:small basic protein
MTKENNFQPFRRDIILMGVLCAVGIGVIALWYSPALLPSSDGDSYLSLARSLAEGKGYRDISLPGEPVAAHFPTGWPLILSMIYRLSGFASLPYQIFMWSLFLLMGIAAYLFARTLLRPWGAFMAAYCLTAHAVTAEFTQTTLTEIPFSLFLYCGLFLFGISEKKKSLTLGIAAMTCLVFTTFLKFYGELILPAAFIALLIKRRWKLLGILILLIILKIGIQFGTQGTAWIHGGKMTQQPLVNNIAAGTDVASASTSLLQTILLNFRRMTLTHIPHNVFPSLYHLYAMNKLKILVCLFFSSWVFLGMILTFFKKDVFSPLVCAALLTGLLTRSDGPYIFRYYAPVGVFFAVFGIIGVRWALEKISRRNQAILPPVRIALIAASIVFLGDKALFNIKTHNSNGVFQNPSSLAEFNNLCACIGETSSDSSLLMSPTASTVYVRTNRKTAFLKYSEGWTFKWNEQNCEAWVLSARGQNAGYLLLPGGWLSMTSFDVPMFESSLKAHYPDGFRRLTYGTTNPDIIYNLSPLATDSLFCSSMTECLGKKQLLKNLPAEASVMPVCSTFAAASISLSALPASAQP